MYKEIFFDHTFNVDPNHRFLKSLEKMGFELMEGTVEHPGKVMCRFIKIDGRYLEFAHIGKGGEFVDKAGFSFGASHLKKYHEKIKKKAYFETLYLHKNYNWKENNVDELPGWNFLSFQKTGVRTIYPWFTEYEPHPNRKSRKKSPKHANGITKIFGAEFNLNAQGEKLFSTILGAKLKPVMQLPCGFRMYFNFGYRTSHYKNVILQSKNLKKTKTFMPQAIESEFDQKPSLILKNPQKNKRMWDLIII